jgi:MFS family permease
MSFAVYGLIAGLAGTLLAETFHDTSPAVTGLSIFIGFGSGAVAQTTTTSWPLTRLFATGVVAAIFGLGVLVASAWLKQPSLALFLIGCVIAGAGCGAIFKGSIQTVIGMSSEDERAGALAFFFTVGYLGISLPVIGAGAAIQFISPRLTLLLFGTAVAIGLLVASPGLIRRRSQSAAPIVRLDKALSR